MKKYYLNNNQQDSGDYEVHNEDCNYCPKVENRFYLGKFSKCQDAVAMAKRKRPVIRSQIDGCYWCCRPCHKR